MSELMERENQLIRNSGRGNDERNFRKFADSAKLHEERRDFSLPEIQLPSSNNKEGLKGESLKQKRPKEKRKVEERTPHRPQTLVKGRPSYARPVHRNLLNDTITGDGVKKFSSAFVADVIATTILRLGFAHDFVRNVTNGIFSRKQLANEFVTSILKT